MTCDEIRQLLDAWYDGDLDAPRSASVERHLEECPGCAALSGAHSALSEVLTESAESYRAPVALRKKLETQISAPPAVRGPRLMPWRGLAIAASIALFVMLGWNVSLLHDAAAPPANIEHEIVADHIRSLMANHLSDVASEDRQTVKPWFTGKLDYAPNVDDLAKEGFKLIGGRLDYAGGMPVAALVYQRRAHVINVFEWPTRDGDDALPQPRWRDDHGYHLANWTRDGMTYWAISDVDPAELTRFTNLLGAQ
ncbi:MAG TPA: anti-sigma factor [Candidatus Binataceae bacterium]|nr:anti-sigma factor [Candidatus Binataceae bacterium]